MGVIIKRTEYEKATEGLHNVTITRVEDMGQKDTQNGPKAFVKIVMTVEDQKDKEGKKVEVQQQFAQSLGAKSFLRKFLTQLGCNVDGKEFDMDEILGVKCQVVVEHVDKDGTTYANVASVIKQRKGTPTDI